MSGRGTSLTAGSPCQLDVVLEDTAGRPVVGQRGGLITTEPASTGVEVIATKQGRAVAERARPVHAAAVRRYLAAPLEGLDTGNFRLALERLAG